MRFADALQEVQDERYESCKLDRYLTAKGDDVDRIVGLEVGADDTDGAAAASEGRGIGIEIELPSAMDEIEKQVIEATLDYTDGDKSRAARLLNIGRKTLYRKLEQFGND